ncbi:MAG: hypothetical protein ABII25_01180 [bacterium]
MRNRKLWLILFFVVLFAGCSISNPLSELSWGTATVIGRVTRSYTVTSALGTTTEVEGVPGALVKTDSGTEQTFTNAQGYYVLTLTFRVGSAAKEKKVKITAFDKDNAGKTASVTGDVIIRDGLTITVQPITWAK